ncbi:MAG: SUMF1/EgtB/PvdO family nonheme iron enzyme, partial [Coleofasciculaceae cyanobacterium SM2_1_6]|nr:SUMF1/EgtB/PvdO family nonheme iron enzyme [Coleofasciculaceae cyanobacterium SM2_1_6]
DIYSLGVSCLQLLTNIDPLNLFDNNGELLWRDYLVNNPVQNNLGKILDKMAKSKPRERYELVREILQDINSTKSESSSKWIDMVTGTANFLFNPFHTTNLIEKAFVKNFNTKNTGISFIEYIKNNNLLPGGVFLEMIAIPGGSFQMGDENFNYAQPVHQVNIRPFYLGKYPVTQEQYQAVIGTNPSRFKGAKRPVENVSWHNAVEFCQKISLKTGKNYRLPSEAEWEFACRAGTQTKYYFGDDETQLGNYAWYGDNSSRETHPVGQKKKNQFGLYDMHGNVWEYCSDHWHENYNGAPTDGSSWETGKDNRRVLRGGYWYSNAVYCRSSYREKALAGNSFSPLGFRMALDIT